MADLDGHDTDERSNTRAPQRTRIRQARAVTTHGHTAG